MVGKDWPINDRGATAAQGFCPKSSTAIAPRSSVCLAVLMCSVLPETRPEPTPGLDRRVMACSARTGRWPPC